MARCRKFSFDGGSPERCLPFQSSLESRDGSSLPRLEPVGVNSQPSSQRALMLPVEPCVKPRSKMDLPSSQIRSRSLFSCIHSLQLRQRFEKEVRATEVARLEGERDRLILQAFGPGHAGINLRANPED